MSSSTRSDARERWVVAMSGGVDSSVAAWMLCGEGLSVIGLFMRNGVKAGADAARKSCCSAGDARDARMVAAQLGIPFQAVDLAQEFGAIIRYFTAEYARGRTPNPCAVCNRDLKFDRLLGFAEELGARGIATGHYARLALEDGRPRVRRGVDRAKDQSYQLFCVSEANLARTRLPIGGMRKPEVRALAARAGLRTAAKADSQEICFVPGNDYRRLLSERGVALHPGLLVDTSGRTLGRHAGVEHFTIGQRRGHGVAGEQPLYVVALDAERGEVVLGTRAECGAEAAVLEELNWIGFDPPASGELECEVQYRYGAHAARARVLLDGSRARVLFDEPEPAVAPGQGAAFYSGDLLLGGGWIAAVERAAAAPAPR
jgi:tRNA-specific 2-thiouridylase